MAVSPTHPGRPQGFPEVQPPEAWSTLLLGWPLRARLNHPVPKQSLGCSAGLGITVQGLILHLSIPCL